MSSVGSLLTLAGVSNLRTHACYVMTSPIRLTAARGGDADRCGKFVTVVAGCNSQLSNSDKRVTLFISPHRQSLGRNADVPELVALWRNGYEAEAALSIRGSQKRQTINRQAFVKLCCKTSPGCALRSCAARRWKNEKEMKTTERTYTISRHLTWALRTLGLIMLIIMMMMMVIMVYNHIFTLEKFLFVCYESVDLGSVE